MVIKKIQDKTTKGTIKYGRVNILKSTKYPWYKKEEYEKKYKKNNNEFLEIEKQLWLK